MRDMGCAEPIKRGFIFSLKPGAGEAMVVSCWNIPDSLLGAFWELHFGPQELHEVENPTPHPCSEEILGMNHGNNRTRMENPESHGGGENCRDGLRLSSGKNRAGNQHLLFIKDESRQGRAR